MTRSATPASLAGPAASRAQGRWADRRRRCAQLAARHPHAAQMLSLYARLLDVQEPAFRAAVDDRPAPARLPAWVAERVAPGVAAATAAHGPAPLAARLPLLVPGAADAVAAWLAGANLPALDCYLARAAAAPVVEALAACGALPAAGAEEPGRCPCCGGLPQLSFFEGGREALVTAPRRLLCSRCAATWPYARMTCPGCGETASGRLPIYGEDERFPHLRADACESCRRYLLTVDLRKDPEAVPEVDELAALPLDLYVQERGFAKIVPNLMGIG